MAVIVVEFVAMFEPVQNTVYPKEQASVSVKQLLTIPNETNNYKPFNIIQ